MKVIIIVEVGPDRSHDYMMAPEEVYEMMTATVKDWEFDKVEVIVEGFCEENRITKELTPLKPIGGKGGEQ